jgi:hypothetical protein
MLELDDLPEVTTRIFKFVSTFPVERHQTDPALAAAQARARKALAEALAPCTERWSNSDRVLVTAMLDTMWNYTSYTRLVADWDLDPNEAIRGITWLMSVAVEAIRNNHRPGAQ